MVMGETARRVCKEELSGSEKPAPVDLSRFGIPNRPNYALLAGLARRLGMVALPVHTGAVMT